MVSATPMKVDQKNHSQQALPFKQLLAEARADMHAERTKGKPPSPALTPLLKGREHGVLRARPQVNEAYRLGVVRAEGQQTARKLSAVREAGVVEQQAARQARLIDLIAREFSEDRDGSWHRMHPERPSLPPPTMTQMQFDLPHPPPPQQQPQYTKLENLAETPVQTRAAQAVALIEHIELFVKSQRPGLALTLNNSLGAHVQIQRVGPREIALKLVGHAGPPTAEAVARIREELRARGLKLSALCVA